MAASMGRETRDESQASLVPILERVEHELRTEVEQVRLEADNQIRQAEMWAKQHIQEGLLSISKFVEEIRKERLAELQKRAEQLSRSSEERGEYLRQQVERNMTRAVKRVVDAVTGAGDET